MHHVLGGAARPRSPDAVFLANGPGDPAALDHVVESVRGVVGKVPVFGICMGHQLLCRAIGLETFKLPFGHRGANHPVKDLQTGKIDITSQNHGFAVRGPGGETHVENDQPVSWDTDFGVAELSHVNLYDRTVEGLVLRDVRGATAQYHPEAGPGPHDARTCSTASSRWRRRPRMPRRNDISKILALRLGADRDRPGGRVRLLRRAGLQGAARGGLRGRARQLQPGDDHDRPRVRDRDLHRAAAARAGARRSSSSERPDALLPTLGGQTALNLAMALHEDGMLERYGVELIGANYEAIRRAEDREVFRETMERGGPARCPARSRTKRRRGRGRARPASACPRSSGRPSRWAARAAASRAPRPSSARSSPRASRRRPIGQVLVEESVIGWGEFELEVMRDRNDNVVIVCSIENIDPMGVHTGDSVTVAPQQTLTDRAVPEAARPGDRGDPRGRRRDRRLEHPVRRQPGDRARSS